MIGYPRNWWGEARGICERGIQVPALLIYIPLPTREHLFIRLAGLNPALPPCRRRFSARTVC